MSWGSSSSGAHRCNTGRDGESVHQPSQLRCAAILSGQSSDRHERQQRQCENEEVRPRMHRSGDGNYANSS